MKVKVESSCLFRGKDNEEEESVSIMVETTHDDESAEEIAEKYLSARKILIDAGLKIS